ncbi:restriction endonuclease subunit S [Vibrio neptunius]|uniref:restriction endonuclease subunit S n=1 Tax=Vibrio neptunius TaxID=170651 RepID=UPI001C5CAB2A|nr:restriction endonuclease subunit S [Vibrio neptunius]QXX06084.1 restriction endonuclease subunit S [Vibrio neptunius]
MSFELHVPEGWSQVKLSDLGEVNRGRSRHRPRDAAHLYGGPYPFVQTGDVKASKGRITQHSQTYSEDGLAQSRLWPKGTMCITIAANIAETGILTYPACFPDSVIGFIADESKCNVYFIEYVFRLLRKRIQAQATGSVQDNINLQTLERLLFPIPALEEQNRIAAVLGELDDKIHLNYEINQTLEEIAQATFKSWFVDFEPVKAKMNGEQPEGMDAATASLFPEKLVESELGLIPEGWEVGELTELAKLDTTSVKPNKEPETIWEHYSIPAFDDGYYPSFDTGESIKSNKYKVKANAVLVSKLNPRFQRIWLPLPIDAEQAICSTEFMQFVPNAPALKPYLYSLVKSTPFQNELMNTVTGTTGSRQRAQPKQVAKAQVVVPPSQLMELYSEKVGAMFSMTQQNIRQNIELAKLRDTLLPKLLSGEIELETATEN